VKLRQPALVVSRCALVERQDVALVDHASCSHSRTHPPTLT
jgi:hypothetical protein